MKATQVTYARLFNLGNYDNEKIEVQVQLEEGETAEQGLARAKAFVESKGPNGSKQLRDYQIAKQRLDDRRDLTMRQIELYEKTVADFEAAQALDTSL